MRTIPLTKGYVAIVDDEDYERIARHKWHARTGKSGTVYGGRLLMPGRVFQSIHRIVMDAPDGVEVDHVDGNGLNNRKSNLRFASHEQNCGNRMVSKNNTSGFKGVSRHGRNWRACIRVGYRRYSLGTYPTPVLAAAAYDAAAQRFFGAFARVNGVTA